MATKLSTLIGAASSGGGGGGESSSTYLVSAAYGNNYVYNSGYFQKTVFNIANLGPNYQDSYRYHGIRMLNIEPNSNNVQTTMFTLNGSGYLNFLQIFMASSNGTVSTSLWVDIDGTSLLSRSASVTTSRAHHSALVGSYIVDPVNQLYTGVVFEKLRFNSNITIKAQKSTVYATMHAFIKYTLE